MIRSEKYRSKSYIKNIDITFKYFDLFHLGVLL